MLIPFPSVRVQLALIALVVLVLPWVGVQTIREIESLLRQQLVQSATSTANTIREGIRASNPMLLQHDATLRQTPAASEVILSSFTTPVTIDGYADDWPVDAKRQRYDAANNLLAGSADSTLSYDLIAGIQNGRLLLLFDVTDDSLQQGTSADLINRKSDFLLLGASDINNNARQYLIGSNAPGWQSVLPTDSPSNPEGWIKAELQAKQGGYILEVSIPYAMVSTSVAFALHDADKNKTQTALIGNTHPEKTADDVNTYGILIAQPKQLALQLLPYQREGRRISILDNRGNILATQGNISAGEGQQSSGFFDALYRLVLIADKPADAGPRQAYRLSTAYAKTALQGSNSHRFLQSSQSVGQLAVAIPILIDNQITGALVVEESTAAISSIRQQAIFNIIKMTFLTMLVIVFVLLLFGGLLVSRIRRLNRQLQSAVGDDGRLHETIPRSLLSDEIGDLNRGVVSIVGRLNGYQRYMETMASKLSHELRTPLTVVQSSLENIQGETDQAKHDELLQRANDGLSRLRLILTSLTEASRLENALSNTEREPFDLVKVVRGCAEGYRQAYPNNKFEFNADIEIFQLTGSPELIAQLLDKLISNAIDFHTPDTAMIISIKDTNKGCSLSVANQGPPLPRQLRGNVFDSMVSDREKKGDAPHLGLGLYIVRLISEYHGAEVKAVDTKDGVNIQLSFS